MCGLAGTILQKKDRSKLEMLNTHSNMQRNITIGSPNDKQER